MSLTVGTRLGVYEVLGLLGEGGMGQVYRARDTRLGREVALKVLPAAVTDDAVRVARFEREARSLAALNHPNVAQVYGFEDRALVMELLEGETLRDRLRDGALPVRKAIDYATQIARGLAAAHDRGIIHRDLKPENVFVLTDGHVKILDFGLARQDAPVSSGATETVAVLPAATDPGTVMGSVGYMAPEQVRGGALDARADLFALGAVLYEMLTGQRAFRRDTAAETLTAILREDPPDLTASRADLSPTLDRIVRHCLEKNPVERFQTARDVAFALDSLSGSGTTAAAAAVTAVPAPSRSLERWVWMGVTAVLAVATAWLGVRPHGAAPTVPAPAQRLSLLLPSDDLTLDAFLGPMARLAMSPDGQRLAFVVSNKAGRRQLMQQSLLEARPHLIDDSEGAAAPAWSPDSKWIAFGVRAASSATLKKVAVDGSPPVVLASNAGYLQWAPDGAILIAPHENDLRLVRTTASGGALEPVPPPTPSIGGGYPWLLPDGKHYFFDTQSRDKPDLSGTWVASVDEPGGRRIRTGSQASQLVYANGFALFSRSGTLFARPFDLGRLDFAGEAVPLADDVEERGGSGAFSVSQAGTLVYQPRRERSQSRLVWLSRSGAPLGTLSDEADYSNLELSRDGKRLLVSVLDPALRTRDIYIVDALRGVRQRLTSDPSDERSAMWSPDGRTVYYTSKGLDLYARSSDFTGAEVPIVTDHAGKDPREVSPDGRRLLFRRTGATTGSDIMSVALDPAPGAPEPKAEPVLTGTFNENYASFSPDGKSIVYVSNDSGQDEVYVLSLEAGGGKVQISSDHGSFPRWRRDGREIIYLNGDSLLMIVPVTGSGARFVADAPRELFRLDVQPGPGSPFDMTPDGQRFIVNAPVPTKVPPHLTVIVNWPALAKR